VIVSQTAQFAEDKNLGLGEATTSDGVQFTYPSGGTPPQVGSVLFANVGEDMYLRKVDSVTPTADGGIVVQTSDAGLADVIEQGTINTEMTLFDVAEESARSRVNTRSRRDHSVMRWSDNLLVAEQENFDQHGATVRSTRDVKEQVGVSASLGFTPSLRTKLSWRLDLIRGVVITHGEIIARGQFNADANAFYNFEAAGSAEKEIPLFKRVFTMRYLVGGVPVYQRNILSVKAVLSANASSEIKANAGASATAAIEMGARYNPATGAWDTIPPTPSFEKSFKAGLDVKGNVHGEVRLVPNLQVEFYRMVATDLSIEPFIAGDVAAGLIPKGELLAEFGYLPLQLTQFDINLQAQAFVGVSVGIFSKKFPVLGKTQVWESPQWTLFSLPKLSASGGSGKVNEPITLTATTEDGVNDPFKDGSIQWFVSPNKGSVSGGKTGTFTSGEEGSYTVFFSGHGYLGDPLARQFAVADVVVGKGNWIQEDQVLPEPIPSSLTRCKITGYCTYGASYQTFIETCYEDSEHNKKTSLRGWWRNTHNQQYEDCYDNEERIVIELSWGEDGTIGMVVLETYKEHELVYAERELWDLPGVDGQSGYGYSLESSVEGNMTSFDCVLGADGGLVEVSSFNCSNNDCERKDKYERPCVLQPIPIDTTPTLIPPLENWE